MLRRRRRIRELEIRVARLEQMLRDLECGINGHALDQDGKCVLCGWDV